MTHDEFCEFLRELCDKEGGQAAWAKKHGISSPYVSDVIAKNRAPGPKVCSAAGVTKEVIYRRAQPNE